MNKILIGCFIIATIALLGAGAMLATEATPSVTSDAQSYGTVQLFCAGEECQQNNGCSPGIPPC